MPLVYRNYEEVWNRVLALGNLEYKNTIIS